MAKEMMLSDVQTMTFTAVGIQVQNHHVNIAKKIAENRRFRLNGWPKSKTNTGNGFLGVDNIYLDTSFVILSCIA